MKAILLFSLLFFCSIASYPQSVVFTSGEIALLPGGYSIQSPTGHVSDIGFQNPAFLSHFKGTSFGLSYQSVSSIEKAYISEIPYNGRDNTEYFYTGESILNFLPYSASITYQKGNLHLAAALARRYNLRYKSPLVHYYNGWQKDNVQVSRFGDIHDYSLVASYLINDIPEGNSLSLGSRISLGRLNYASYNHYALMEENLETASYSFGFALGAEYRFVIKSGVIALGADYEKGEKYSDDIYKKPKIIDDGRPWDTVFPDISFHDIDVITPDVMTFDASLETAKFQFAARASEVFWNDVSDIYKNNLDFSASVVYNGMKHLSIYLGANMNKRIYAINPQSGLTDYKALFITIGEETKVDNYTFGFSISDSHLASADTRKQTMGRFTLSYQF